MTLLYIFFFANQTECTQAMIAEKIFLQIKIKGFDSHMFISVKKVQSAFGTINHIILNAMTKSK